MTPRIWYASMELRQGTQNWEGLAKQFVHTFEFVDEQPTVDVALQMIKENIFVEIPIEEEIPTSAMRPSSNGWLVTI